MSITMSTLDEALSALERVMDRVPPVFEANARAFDIDADAVHMAMGDRSPESGSAFLAGLLMGVACARVEAGVEPVPHLDDVAERARDSARDNETED